MSFEDCNEYSEDFFVEEEKKNNDEDGDDDSNNNLSMNTSSTSIEFHPSIIESIIEEDVDDDDDDGDGINNNVTFTPSKILQLAGLLSLLMTKQKNVMLDVIRIVLVRNYYQKLLV
jgi:hypothetical protein